MAVHNTSSDAANTAVRAYLTEIGEHYLHESFNTNSKKGKAIWEKIRDVVFEGKCAFCGKKSTSLEKDHLIMINKAEFGLHHPGNLVPACKTCNKRSKKEDSNVYTDWIEHLSYICEENNEKDKFQDRYKRIMNHTSKGEYKYPELSHEEKRAIQIIANNLYEKVKSEFDNSIKLYMELDKTFSRKRP